MAMTIPSVPRRGPGEISVTEVRNALRCPRVFALGRSRGHAVAFPIGASSLGAVFHRIAEVFAREVDSPPAAIRELPAGASRERVERALAAWLLRHLVEELEANPSVASMPAEIDDLAEALRELARYLAAEIDRSHEAPEGALRALVQHAELGVEAVIDAPCAQPIRLVGRVDAVHCRASGALDVVEYKLTDEANEELDQAQVALYRHLCQRALNVDVEPVILRFNPGLIATRLSPAAADSIVERKLLPLLDRMAAWSDRPETAPPTARRDLCPACPVRAACAETYRAALEPRDAPPAGAARLLPSPEGVLAASPLIEPAAQAVDDITGIADADALAKQIIAELRKQGVTAAIVGTTLGPRLIRVEVQCQRQRVAQLDRAANDVAHHLASRDVHFEREGARRFFWAPRAEPRRVDLAVLLARESSFLRERPGRFVVGEGVEGGVITGDLSDGSSCHLLVAGQTGSGKSVLLRAIIGSLCHFHPPSSIQLTLVDPKRVTFGALAPRIAAHLAGPICYDVEALLPELDDLVAEMEARYDRFERCGAEDINDHNENARDPLPRRVVVVDEFQDLLADKATKQAFLDAVKRLGAKARAAGIHLILATQRPDKNTVPGEIKANLNGRIALRVQALVNSRIILDRGGAEELLGRGDLLADLGHGVVRAQAPMA